MWVRSYRRSDAIPRSVPANVSSTTFQVQSFRGRVSLVRYRIIATGRSSFADILGRFIYMFSRDAGMFLQRPAISNGFGFGRAHSEGGESHNGQTIDGYWIDVFAVPYWFLTGLACIPPLCGVVSIVKRRRAAWRRSNQRCESCGYDLRGTPERCPECGMVRTSGAAAQAEGRATA